VKVGVHLPQWGDGSDRAGVLSFARVAEAAGFDAIWVADHIAIPTESASSYPYRVDGIPFAAADGFLEALTVLAVVAGATSSIGLGTSVLVMPMREPVLTAKSVATLDHLSGGRVVLAMGTGWWAEEFHAVGAPFAGRGRRFDEQIQILKKLWSSGTAAHQGEYYDFDELTCRPLPVRPGGPPILVGGLGPAARRRAATLGDGWHAIGSDAAAIASGFDEVKRWAEDAGRDPATISLSTSTGAGTSSDRLLARLQRLADIGVDRVVLNLVEAGSDGQCRALERVGTEVIPRLL
jgi:probable F420-dependent oxidoreductase